MNTKKKNKNRPKPPKIAPKLDSTECDKPESVDSVVNVSNIESEKKSQIEEISPVILPIEEKAASEKNVSDEVPKKPERMKGKKQQESINEDNKTNILEEDQKITILEENVHITPKSRKKKNKDKKQSSTEEVIKTEVDDRIGKTIVEDIKQDKEKIKDTLETSINVSQEEQDNKMSKKKKKKRNRHDSQKSDVDESATYNLAFKNLLEATDNVTEANTPSDSTKNIEISLDSDEKNSLKPLTKPNINTNLSDQEEQNTIKNKKKGKKQKQHHEKTDEVNTRSEILTIDKQVVSSADVTEPSLSDSVIKAKIAKPVDRKHNVKSPKQNKSTDNQNTEENVSKTESEFEKTFQDSKTTVDSNKAINEPNETKPSISFPMPSSFVEKSVSSNDNKTMDDPKNIHVCISPEKEIVSIKKETHDQTASENLEKQIEPPICPSRKDNKGKSKSKRKNKQEISASVTTNTSNTEVKPSTSVAKNMNETSQEQKSDKTDNTQNKSQEKGKQQTLNDENNANAHDDILPVTLATDFEPIEKFEDALTSSVDDVNTTFEMIANEIMNTEVTHQNFENPQINIIAPTEEESTDKNTNDKQITPPKNLLGHPDIPVPSNKTDYKKEKNKLPNNQQAKVKVKDSVDIQKKEKVSKKSQTGRTNDTKNFNGSESFSYMTNGNNEFVYKYSFRKVFLQSYCHVCKKQLNQRFPCKFCSLIFYCSQKHVDEDWPRHQPLCFAVSTISHLKDQKHIYADAKGITGQDYRVLRMQMIVSCEKILKRKLVPWEQEALLYPRICADSNCREWRQSKLNDCKGCEQISYCSDKEAHLPTEHLRWCKSYALYKKLVNYQQTKGRLEPPMPTKILENYEIPEKINDVLASMYEEKIDMNDIQYAALTQLATAPLTVAYCYQIFSNNNSATNKYLKKTSFTVHVVGAELQFEADGLNKWEVFLLHLRPDIKDLRIVLVNQDLNPSKLPLDLLGKVQLCENCKTNKRRVIFSFQDKLSYNAYYSSDDFITPDIVCAFNPSIERSSIYNGKDSWPSTTQCILKQKVPFIITSYTLEELKRDLERVEQFGDIKSILEPKPNPFASVRPDRNFITDHEIPLLFKNYCLSMVCAA
ncbi:bromodomain-containing protein DDB_G0280777 isoform X2 [Aricia agestis]|uniref:bromodomain-containing protein DDB_G0280777 isoform X2 n=1 Tax=Aricia agestis TaxID=91739 RepID=UPI001C2041C5|nr:bromodomain-containing protein DDB_G0280777 isoform X2 [Aricia agestis]